MFQYYCLNPISKVGLEGFTESYTNTQQLEEADGILVRSASMHEMELPENLLAVARAGAGVNNIPLDKCAEKGIVVFNTPGANANGVKEIVIAGMLLAARDIVDGINWVRENSADANVGKAAEKVKKNFAGTEIQGKKLGIIGLGAIGVKVANTARHLGMEVYGYDPYVSVDAAWNLSRDVKHVIDVNEIYEKCDFITIHVPLMDSTKGMINEEAITKMKDGVILLNFARDLLVDEKAVLNAIESGKVRRYVSDFPNPVTAGRKGCIVIPHLGASTEESEDNCAVMAVKELMDYLENGNILNAVNLPSISMAREPGTRRICVIHRNVPNTIAMFAATCGDAGINIENMQSKSRGEYAYTILDVSGELSSAAVEALRGLEPIVKVRVIQ